MSCFYVFVFNNFHHKQRSYFALEQWLDKDDEMAAKHADYLVQTDVEVKRVIAAMEAGVADDGKKEEEDW
jgi:hypothetical protein